MGLGQLITKIPILQAAQLGQATVFRQQGVLIHPPHAGRVGPDLRGHALGHASGGEVEVLQHARACPVDIGAVLKNDVNERGTEEGESPHHLGSGHRQHGCCQRVGNLVLDHLRCLSWILGVDDDLDVGQVRQGIQRCADHGIDAGRDNEQGGKKDQEAVAPRPIDDSGEHFSSR